MALSQKEQGIVFGIAAALVVVVIFLSQNDRSQSPETAQRGAASLERLNSFIHEKTGRNLYERYVIEDNGNSVTIYLSPSLWNSLSSGEQRQLCDFIAMGRFMSEMNLSSALLYVGNTLVGGIGRSGGNQWFSPELNSLR
jgi:hypothetical protein